MATCEHLEPYEGAPSSVTPTSEGCLECLQTGSTWVHLRLCLACGHVGCCDSSPNHHATEHFHATGHPAMKSFEPDEDWGWCYIHRITSERLAALPPQRPTEHDAAP